MIKARRLRSAAILLCAMSGLSCGSNASEEVLTVEEVAPRIGQLNGRSVRVAGYLSTCRGYDCILFRNKEDADAWGRFVEAVDANRRVSVPDPSMLGIGSGTNFEFDAKAAPYTNSHVVITGTITDGCRLNGQPACLDRSTDLRPTAIRAGRRPEG